MFQLAKVKNFIKLILNFQKVERRTFVPDTDRNENDCEHSYMLAMLCWYLTVTYKLKYDLGLVLQYALIHDLVEVFAGDTFPFDPADQATKNNREEAALTRLREQYPEAEGMLVFIDKYEARADPESRFVHSLDKVLPVFVNLFTEGKAWKKNGVTLPDVINEKLKKVRDPAVMKMFDELAAELQREESKYFPLVTEPTN